MACHSPISRELGYGKPTKPRSSTSRAIIFHQPQSTLMLKVKPSLFGTAMLPTKAQKEVLSKATDTANNMAVIHFSPPSLWQENDSLANNTGKILSLSFWLLYHGVVDLDTCIHVHLSFSGREDGHISEDAHNINFVKGNKHEAQSSCHEIGRVHANRVRRRRAIGNNTGHGQYLGTMR